VERGAVRALLVTLANREPHIIPRFLSLPTILPVALLLFALVSLKPVVAISVVDKAV